MLKSRRGGIDMKILFYDAKSYDEDSFNKTLEKHKDITINYLESDLRENTVNFAKGYDAVCGFVNSTINAEVLKALNSYGVKLVLLRAAGYNNVDFDAANKYKITVMRVPGYSPEAVAEMAMALALAVNRRIHKAYIKVRENNFSLQGLTGITFYGKTAGIIGTGKIGQAMARICNGFGMKVIAYDKYPAKNLDFVKYVSLEDLLKESDLISLHCPLTVETYHMINKVTIGLMKKGVILVNTSRGGLIDTEDLIAGIRERKFFGVALDVYEEEGNNVFENREDDYLEHSTTARLLSFPNVILTSHQGFLTKEALISIAETTLDNADSYAKGAPIEQNIVRSLE
jgi:D-lactate dehydrogenase